MGGMVETFALRVDTHVHVVCRDLAAYPLRPHRPGVDWFTEHPCPADEFMGLMDASGIEQAVLVQAMGAYSDDNTYCVEKANDDPRRFTAVVYVDLSAPGADPDTMLARWAAAGATGVRVVAGTVEGAPTLNDPAVAALIEAAVELDVRVLLTTFEPALADLPGLLDRVGNVPVAIDHCAFPDLTGGPPYAEARPLFEAAALPNVHVKVSTNALDQSVKAGGDPRDFVTALVDAYGPERIQWGSDWSQTHDRPYSELVAYAGRAFSVIPENARHWVEGDAARLFWRWNG
jgi:predicted TIM-barrel fold metal-dependent hydrolase